MSTDDNSLLYTDNSIVSTTIHLAKIHPIVIFKIADQYDRRPEDINNGNSSDKIPSVGLLYGKYDKSRFELDILDAVPLLLKEEEKDNKKILTLDNEFYNQINEDHETHYPLESIVGWYTFGESRFDVPINIQEDSYNLHLWMRPSNPPKIDAFAVIKPAKQNLVSTPIRYIIDATDYEQVCLSRLDASNASDSLQAAINELIKLLNEISSKILEKKIQNDILLGRKIYAALAKIRISSTDREALTQSLEELNRFVQQLDETDKAADAATKVFRTQLD